MRIRQSLFRRLANLGDRLGWEWLIYNWGVTWSYHQCAMTNAPKFADALLARFPAVRSIADIGCGTGAYLAEFQKRGLLAVGCEYSRRHRRWARKAGVPVCPFDLRAGLAPLPGVPFDCAFSIEVAEHIAAELAVGFVSYTARHSDLVVWTAAQPGQGGEGHVNEQPQEYWIERFSGLGFSVDPESTGFLIARLREAQAAHFLCNNLIVFRRNASKSIVMVKEVARSSEQSS